jgi:hypothetical protein
MAAVMGRRGGQGKPSLDGGMELAERSARRAVTDFWGQIHGFTEESMDVSASSPNPSGLTNRIGPSVEVLRYRPIVEL